MSPGPWLVTGASSGIGLALVKALAGRGETVMASGRRDKGALPTTFPDIAYCAADLARPDGPQALLNALPIAPRRVILNAGAGFYRGIEAETAGDIARVVDTNLTANIMLAHALFPILSGTRGQLALIGSVAWRGVKTMPVYSASKAALDGLARNLRSEWAGRVDVRIIHPGPTATGMSQRAGRPPDLVDRFMLPPDAMAQAILDTLAGKSRLRTTLSLGRIWPALAFRAIRWGR